MSGLSLREQLLQAGLVSEKQVRQAEQGRKRQDFTDRKQVGKKDRNFREEQRQAELQKQAAAKAAKDAELNRKREEKAAAKARWAEIRQLVEQNRIAKPESDDYFNFVNKGKVGHIRVDASLGERIVRGEIALVRCDGHYELVPAEAGERGREREPRAEVDTSGKVETTPVDDAYKDFDDRLASDACHTPLLPAARRVRADQEPQRGTGEPERDRKLPIAPGFIRSAMTDALTDTQKEAILAKIPAGALGEGDDIAAAAAYLASRQAGYVTGQTLHVNGGMAMI